jgi:hypothetical protein
MEDTQFAKLRHELRIIAKLLTWNLLQGKNLTEKALTLSSLGLETREIADLLQKDSDLISQTLYQAKKTKRSKRKEATENG